MNKLPEGGHGNPLQYSCLENLMDRGAWWTIVHRIAKTRLKQLIVYAHMNIILLIIPLGVQSMKVHFSSDVNKGMWGYVHRCVLQSPLLLIVFHSCVPRFLTFPNLHTHRHTHKHTLFQIKAHPPNIVHITSHQGSIISAMFSLHPSHHLWIFPVSNEQCSLFPLTHVASTDFPYLPTLTDVIVSFIVRSILTCLVVEINMCVLWRHWLSKTPTWGKQLFPNLTTCLLKSILLSTKGQTHNLADRCSSKVMMSIFSWVAVDFLVSSHPAFFATAISNLLHTP